MHWFSPGFDHRLQFRQPLLRHEHRSDNELALEQPPHDLGAFRYEDALLPVLPLPAHRLVGLQLG